MIKRKHLSSISCRVTPTMERFDALRISPLCSPLYECSHLPFLRSKSIQSSEEFPPKIDENDLEVLEVIAKGAFGRAIKVRHRQLRCTLVLKEVLHDCKEDEEALVREISILRSLKHPNILTCIGIVIKNKRFGLLTEYISEGSLHKFYLGSPNRRAFSWCEITSFARDIAAGMTYLHDHDVIHRDLNTHNCLVRKDHSVVVADFGLSKLVEKLPISFRCYDFLQKAKTFDYTFPETNPRNDTTNTNSDNSTLVTDKRRRGSYHLIRGRCRRHTVVGNPNWMAPEMLAGQPYDNAVDVYSFGVILCQLITRIDADPDILPRDFNTMCVDFEAFSQIYSLPNDENTYLFDLAKKCTSFDPKERPDFKSCLKWLEGALLYLQTNRRPPKDLFNH